VAAAPSPAPPPAAHPLDPLTAEEIGAVAAVLRRDRGVEPPRWRFGAIELAEPAKAALRDGQARRQARAVCWNREDGEAYRAVVSLAGPEVTAWEHLPGAQPNMTVDEWHECDEMLRAHPLLIDALARRGITDLSLVLTDVWAYGAALVPERYHGVRIGWADVWRRGSADANPYAHSVTGLHPIVDLNRITFIDSTGLGALVATARRANEHGGILHAVCAEPQTLKLLWLTGVDRRIPLTATVDGALTQLAGPRDAPG